MSSDCKEEEEQTCQCNFNRLNPESPSACVVGMVYLLLQSFTYCQKCAMTNVFSLTMMTSVPPEFGPVCLELG